MLTLQELNAGIAYWRTTFWPNDFHNRFYGELADINENGRFTINWWNRILPHLSCWRATRPKSAEELTQMARPRLERLQRAYQAIANAPNDIAANALVWETVEEFTTVATEIKGAKTPTFCSKLCHFTSPRRFPVIDSAAMDLPARTYPEYWILVKNEWHESLMNRDALINRFQDEAGVSLRRDFPYACKITEICLIGRNRLNKGVSSKH